jgi:GT2 family glycosyltransferase
VTLQILAILVLYKMAPEQSQTFRSLEESVRNTPGAADAIRCIIYDNSPEPHALPSTPIACEYRHDASNPGLAKPYQDGFNAATAAAIPWLLLLDQDTRLTAAYLQEVFKTIAAQEPNPRVAAIAPKLRQDSDLMSPHWPVLRWAPVAFDGASGLIERRVLIYNSAAVLRVRSLQEIGGFPQDFPLDFLDHAVFTRLHRAGKRIFLLNTVLEHHLGSRGMDVESRLYEDWRLQSIFASEARFYRQLGTSIELLFFAWRRLRLGISMLQRREFASFRTMWRCTFS